MNLKRDTAEQIIALNERNNWENAQRNEKKCEIRKRWAEEKQEIKCFFCSSTWSYPTKRLFESGPTLKGRTERGSLQAYSVLPSIGIFDCLKVFHLFTCLFVYLFTHLFINLSYFSVPKWVNVQKWKTAMIYIGVIYKIPYCYFLPSIEHCSPF